MCGIVGKVNSDSKRFIDTREVEVMLAPIAHRGPDSQGVYVKGNSGLGHRRLSIIDVSGGFQPMANEDESVWIVFNGEIYNFAELRRDLVSKGHVFRSRS